MTWWPAVCSREIKSTSHGLLCGTRQDLFYGGQILDNNFERNLRMVDNVRLVRGAYCCSTYGYQYLTAVQASACLHASST